MSCGQDASNAPDGYKEGIHNLGNIISKHLTINGFLHTDPPLTDKLRFAGGYQNEEIANTDTLSKLLTLGPEWHSKLPSGWRAG